MNTKRTAAAAPRVMRAPGSNLLDFLDIELTERCNLVCRHCYIRRPLHDQDALDAEINCAEIQQLLQEAASLGCQGVRFTGGEPFARNDFIEAYLSAKRLSLSVSLSTNVTLITGELADMLVDNPPETIGISIYGWDSRSYDSVVQVPGAFENFLAGIRILRARKLPFSLKYPALKALVDHSDEIRAFANRLGVSVPLPYTWELTLHARNVRAASDRIRALRLHPEDAARQRLREPDVAMRDMQALRSTPNRRQFDNKLFSCRAARKRLTIDAYGRLQVCLEMRHPETIYHLKTGSLLDALTNHLPRIRDMCITNPEYLKRCGHCVLRSACPHCPACSWMEHGTLDTLVEYHCEVMHAEARLLGILKEGERGWREHP